MGEEIRKGLAVIRFLRGIILMEPAVPAVHDIVFRGVLLPDLRRFHGVEAAGVLLEEGLHPGHLQNALIEVLYPLIPDAGTAFFNDLQDGIRIDDMVTDVIHQLDEDDLMDGREDLGIQKVGNGKLHEAFRQLQLVLGIFGDLADAIGVFAVHPVRDEVIAPGLMRQ